MAGGRPFMGQQHCQYSDSEPRYQEFMDWKSNEAIVRIEYYVPGGKQSTNSTDQHHNAAQFES